MLTNNCSYHVHYHHLHYHHKDHDLHFHHEHLHFYHSLELLPVLLRFLSNIPLKNAVPAVDGGWSDWVNDTTCSATCGDGTLSHTRACDSPAPENGGAACAGSATLVEACNEGDCPREKVTNVQSLSQNKRRVFFYQPALQCRVSSKWTPNTSFWRGTRAPSLKLKRFAATGISSWHQFRRRTSSTD